MVGSALRIQCDERPRMIAQRPVADSPSDDDPGPVDYLADVLGERHHVSGSEPVLIVGRDTVLASVRSVEGWAEGYAAGWAHPGLVIGALGVNEVPRLESELALQSGCVAIVDLSRDASLSDTVRAFGAPEIPLDLSRATDAQFIALATFARGVRTRLSSDQTQALGQVADAMQLHWRGRVAPDVITEFVRRYGQ
jgi:hypothetical protein